MHKVSQMKDKGWVSTPVDIEGHKPIKPNPAPGELVEGKIAD